MSEPPKSGGKGESEPPKSGGKGNGEPPKSGGKGAPAGGNGGNINVAVDVFQQVAELGGLLSITFTTPIGGTRSVGEQSSSARSHGLAEVRRKALLRQREEANASSPLDPET